MKSLFALIIFSAQASAAINLSLPGTTESAVWTGLNSSNYTSAAGFPGYATTTNLWPHALTADAGSTAGATFDKVSGGGYFASSSLYDAGTPGIFHLTDSAPIGNLANIVFQADVGSAFAGAPMLNINGGAQAIAPNYFTSSSGNYLSGFGGPPSPTTNYAWQWDLSAFGGSINSYEIVWSTAAHGTIYELNLSAGDSFVQAVPEPGTGLLGLAALGLTFIRRRRA